MGLESFSTLVKISAVSLIHVLTSMCTVLGHGHGHSHGGDGHGHSHGGHGHAHIKRKQGLEEEWGVVSDSWLAHLKRRLRRKKKQESSENINVRAAFVHVIGDLIQSIGVVIAGYIIWLRVSVKVPWKLTSSTMYLCVLRVVLLVFMISVTVHCY